MVAAAARNFLSKFVVLRLGTVDYGGTCDVALNGATFTCIQYIDV